jgi:hypothetical protein
MFIFHIFFGGRPDVRPENISKTQTVFPTVVPQGLPDAQAAPLPARSVRGGRDALGPVRVCAVHPFDPDDMAFETVCVRPHRGRIPERMNGLPIARAVNRFSVREKLFAVECAAKLRGHHLLLNVPRRLPSVVPHQTSA